MSMHILEYGAHGDDKKDDADDDDDDDDIYIMMQCLCVCHEKSSLPTSELSPGGVKWAAR